MSRRHSVILPLFLSHKGCPSRCVFCDQRVVTGGGEDIPTLDDMLRRVRAFRATSGGRGVEIAFYGGSFTLVPPPIRNGLLHHAAQLRKRGEITGIRLSTRPDGIDQQIVTLLQDHAVDLVELGVQSFDARVLSASGRGHAPEDAVQAVHLLRGGGIEVGIQLMTGLPGDTPATSRESMKRAVSLAPALVRIHPVVVFRGSELAEMMKRGDYVPWDERTTIETLAWMYHHALVNGVAVARVGLQADRFQEDGSVVGGFWHPSTGEIVRSALWGHFIRQILEGRHSATVTIRTHPSSLPAAAGYRGENRRIAQWLTGAAEVRFLSDTSLDGHTVAVEGAGWSVRKNLVKDFVHEQ